MYLWIASAVIFACYCIMCLIEY